MLQEIYATGGDEGAASDGTQRHAASHASSFMMDDGLSILLELNASWC
jgi:hypothetical protein